MTLRILVHDVGHGQAVHIFTPNNKVIVIDLGCSADHSPLNWLRTNTDTIDRLIITHPHGDHIDEIEMISDLGFKINQLTSPRHLSEEQVYQANQASYNNKLNTYFSLLRQMSHPIPEGQLVGTPAISGGVNIETFGNAGAAPSNINNHSIVSSVEFASSTIVIPGDNEAASWKALLDDSSFASAIANPSIFMASHHGRQSGYHSDIFLENRKPDLCVISDDEVQDTDATSRYTHHAQGWTVHSRDGKKPEKRYAVTTRSDGFIEIEAGFTDKKNPFLYVTAN